jgi:hypothetical protein
MQSEPLETLKEWYCAFPSSGASNPRQKQETRRTNRSVGAITSAGAFGFGFVELTIGNAVEYS